MVFRLLQSLFSDASGQSGKFDPPLIRAAIERVVEGTDPRLRMASHYRKKLWEPVEHAIEYVIELAEALPPPIEIASRRFTSDPRLRALFASSQHLQEILSFGQELQQYRKRVSRGLPVDLYALLRAERTEKTALGVALEGNMIRRDVAQITVNFHNHHVAFPAGSETKTRREIKRRSFDYLIETALKRLTSTRVQKQQLEQQQRLLLQQKTKLLKGLNIALQPLLDPQAATPSTPAAIDRRLRDIETELGRLRADSATLDDHLAKVAATLREPEKYLRLDRVSITLDHMNIRVEKGAFDNANTLTFDDILLGKKRRITTLLIRFPSNELLPERDFFEEANRMLYSGGQPRLTTI
ncbi:MAG: hypothetical protein IPP10_04490 [Candidatus Competibacteraceae bacterium]|nr:hypothetical protein [Candidatus Competibacteraceae bacterium]MBK8897761.1 hypothetical protein [Candidatus Competibacteraceae bacterium]MBK8961567.1 hypothetical protein [Candidatus Competibacteraceae bacterium]MBK9950792.1 hypothetical protein [Candidatus Competibacteraceae bacterium]